jgi:hypothetical protein
MSRITAQEARELAGPTVQERVDAVYPLIRKAAEDKRHRITLHDWWAEAGYIGAKDYKQACDILRADGYNVEFFYEKQACEMYTVVKW